MFKAMAGSSGVSHCPRLAAGGVFRASVGFTTGFALFVAIEK